MTKPLIIRSSLESQLDRPEHPETFPPTKGEPGSTNHSQTHIAGAETPSSSSKTAPAPSCCCNVLLAYEPYSQGPDHDPAEWFRRCPIHQKDNKSFWLFIETLEDFDDAMRSADLTPEGRAFRRELLAMKTNSETEVKIQTPGGVK